MIRSALHRSVPLAGSLLLILFAGACQIPGGEVVSEGDYLVFETLGRGQRGLVADSTERLLRDEGAWNALRDSLHILEEFKPVDFDQMMVVFIALPQETGGYGVEVSTVETREREVIVEYIVTEPASDCIPVVGYSLPYEVVAVSRSDLPVRFSRVIEPYRCTWRQSG